MVRSATMVRLSLTKLFVWALCGVIFVIGRSVGVRVNAGMRDGTSLVAKLRERAKMNLEVSLMHREILQATARARSRAKLGAGSTATRISMGMYKHLTQRRRLRIFKKF